MRDCHYRISPISYGGKVLGSKDLGIYAFRTLMYIVGKP